MGKRERRYKKVNVLKSRKTWFIISIVLISVFTLFFILQRTGAIFQTTTEGEANIDIAFYCIKEDFQTMTLKLENLEPRSDPYIYNFTIANNDGTKRTETNLIYDLTVRTTTNLPINIILFNTTQGNIDITNLTTIQDDDGTYFNLFQTDQQEFGFLQNEQHKYRLEVVLPEIYKSSDYQDIIELIEINVNSKQKID